MLYRTEAAHSECGQRGSVLPMTEGRGGRHRRTGALSCWTPVGCSVAGKGLRAGPGACHVVGGRAESGGQGGGGSEHTKPFGIGNGFQQSLPQLLFAAVLGQQQHVETGVGRG